MRQDVPAVVLLQRRAVTPELQHPASEVILLVGL